MTAILIIDDEDKYLELCRRHMPEHEFVPPARNYREAKACLEQRGGKLDLVLLDVHFEIDDADLLPEDKRELLQKSDAKRALERLRRTQGLLILDRLRRDYPDLPVIVMTSRADLPLEADAERLHAQDYTYLLDDEYLDARALKVQVAGILARHERTAEDGDFFWGQTPIMQDLRRRIGILAGGQLPIIVQGATGTGKTLLAREVIHRRSGRQGPFVAVDLSTIPADLMAAHLFGVVKGAYTGATASREGVLGRAHGGTLFLDEIGNLGLELQKSLLQVLQEGRYRAVGSVEERITDIKLVVATNENLAQMVRQGRFREDLYMRLNPATRVTLPGLRDRSDDFQALLQYFLGRVCATGYNRDLLLRYAQGTGLTLEASPGGVNIRVGPQLPARGEQHKVHLLLHPSSYNLLREFPWPGNFRQLEMTLANLVTFTLVELVDRVAQMDHGDDFASRPDVVPIQPRTVRELVRPWQDDDPDSSEPTEGMRLTIALVKAESLNAASCEVERQYLAWLFRAMSGDLGRMAEVLLGDAGAGRKIQLRMNQLGMRLRELKRGASS